MSRSSVKTVLIQPPNMQRAGEWKKQQVYRTPTNLAGLASFAGEGGFESTILDFDVDGGPIDELVEAILSQKPDVAAFTCLTPRYPITAEIAQRCKKADPHITIVLGGAHVNAAPEKIFMAPAIDYGILGEGEEAFLDLLTALDEGADTSAIPNLIWRDGRETRINPLRPPIEDLDALPFPAWDKLHLESYRDPALYRGAHVGIMTARGCPHQCIFCSSRRAFGNRVRFHSPEYIIAQLDEALNRFGISEFMFYDDTFSLHRGRTEAICNGILEQGWALRYYIQARADTLDKELAALLKASGCLAVAIGVESGDDEMLKLIKKGETKEDIRAAVAACKSAGLPVVTSFIIGLPGDTAESIQATIDFAGELGAEQAKFMISTPYPGTELYEMALQQGKLKEPETIDDFGEFTYYQHVAANLSHVSDEELKRYQQQAYDDYDLVKRPLT